MFRRQKSCWAGLVLGVAVLVGIGDTVTAAVLVPRHGGSMHHSEKPVYRDSAPPTHPATEPMHGVPPFCTIPPHGTNATQQGCLDLETIDAPPAPHDAGAALRPAPRVSTGNHVHGGSGPPMQELNETRFVLQKGPVPLSYMEWDYRTGLGELAEVRRFVSQQAEQVSMRWPTRPVMGVSGGYWRTLADPDDVQGWTRLREDVRSRIGGDQGDQEPGRHQGLSAWIAAQFLVTCFVLLPVLLALQAAESSLSPLAAVAYLGSLVGVVILSELYFRRTPQLYPPNKLPGIMRGLVLLSIVCFGSDGIEFARRVVWAAKNTRHRRQSAWSLLLEGQRAVPGRASIRFVPVSQSSASTDHTMVGTPPARASQDKHVASFTQFDVEDQEPMLTESPAAYGSDDVPLPPRFSVLSMVCGRQPRLYAALQTVHTFISRGLVGLASAVLYIGIAIYTGSCRHHFQNVCLAHGIKGGIFFWYGLLSFARYLGAFGEYGWSWNKRPTLANTPESRASTWRRTMPSAEAVECLVIFLYGVSNTWLERLGAEPGEPYTIKQIQHISIAVMFWFVGLVGMGLESIPLRALMARAVVEAHPASVHRHGEDTLEQQAPPPSYASNFNPFPALVIGVTGVAMAAHHQDYVYEVQIHMLWGMLLAAFALFRMLTYFLLWLRPPSSVLPGRPPTEVLASFSLTCGGLLFMLSNEEVSFAAMRRGYADFMAILNMAIALTAFLFAGTFGVMVGKAWASQRETPPRAPAYVRRTHPWLQQCTPTSAPASSIPLT